MLRKIRSTIYIVRRLVLKGKELVKMLKKDGGEVVRIKGSHHIRKKGNQVETIPVHNTDIPIGLANTIMKRTGLK